MQGTTLKRNTAYHPQTDGQTEVVNRSIETYLRCFTSETPRRWSKWLSWAEYWYNTSYHTSAHTTPFKVLYGQDPPRLVYQGNDATPSREVDSFLEERNRMLEELKQQLLRAQQVMKERADSGRREVHFEVGEMVFLKLRPYRQRSVVQRRNEKLSPRFYGPFEVLERIGQVAYRLKLPATSSIHPVFHASQLKRVIGDQTVEQILPERGCEEHEELIQPDHIVEVKKRGTHAKEGWMVLVRWKGLPEYEATWESYEGIRKQFPDFHLEDKVKLLGAGNDKNYDSRFGVVYSRQARN